MLRLTILSSFLAIFILSCQVFGLQKIQEACNSPLGIQNGKVPDDRFSASSYSPYLYIGGGKHKDMKAKYCRLKHRYAWCANRRGRVQQWVMVDLGRIMKVTAISTQGYAGVGDYFVTSFKLAYSSDKRSWKFAGKKTVQEFVGNKHGIDIKNNTFDPIQARFIKVVPTNYHVRICLRIELYGCATKESFISTTAKPTTTRIISDSKLSTSSKSPTTMNTGLPSSQLIPLTTTKATTTSIKTPKMTSLNQTTTTTNLTSKRKPTSSHVTGLPSNNSTTTEPSSPLAPTTSSSPVAMTTTQPCEGTTSKDALQRKSSDVEEEEEIKNYFIIAGLMGSLVLLGFAGFFILFIILRRRKRKRSWRCQLVDLPGYPYDNGVASNESIDNFLMIAQENNSALPMEM